MKKFVALLLAVLMLGSFATVAFAAEDGDSPVAGEEVLLKIESEIKDGGAKVTNLGEGKYKLEAIEKNGYEFETYEISKLADSRSVEDGYDILSKNGSTWEIRAYTDLLIVVKYKEVNGNPSNNDDGSQSPATGVNYLVYTALILFGLCGVVVASKKLVKTH